MCILCNTFRDEKAAVESLPSEDPYWEFPYLYPAEYPLRGDCDFEKGDPDDE